MLLHKVNGKWIRWKPGDKAWTPVTDHPNFPQQMHCDAAYLFDRSTAEKLAQAWNKFGGEWRWYAKEFTLLPPRSETPEPEDDAQQRLF